MSTADDFSVLPRHVSIIMDGNGRWAKQRGLPRSEGHKQGAKVFKEICKYASSLGIEAVTVYAFSTENWRRPADEVRALMDIFRDNLLEADERNEENEYWNWQVHFAGDPEGMPEDILDLFKSIETKSADKHRTMVNIALNYGGRNEILGSVKKIAEKVKNGELQPEDITEDDISAGLYTSGQPDVDLIIRPSGEYRLSNFMIWQSAYAEFWYSDVLWPDFTHDDFDKAMRDYSERNRRFGGV